MKKYLFLVVFCFFIASCDKKSKIEKEVAAIPVEMKVERFDQLFFETKPEDLHKLKARYPYFFPQGTPDAVWLEKIQDPLWRELYTEVQKKYSNIDSVKQEVTDVFKHAKYYFPEVKTPKLITIIAEMDYNSKAIYADSLVIVSLELYLGKGHKFYQFPKYLKQNFESKQIAPDVVASFASSKMQVPLEKDFMSQMITQGKQLYMKDLLLPNYSDADKIGYTPEQIKWCEENESYIWRYFLEKELLYSTDQKLAPRFINPAPFSKFYLEIDNDSPGQVGAWIGWQIVRAYAKNSEVPLSELLKTNAKEIFVQSKYKPKK